MEGVVCKHLQTGYCKYRDHCKKKHVAELCETLNCNSKACTKRHPRVCKFILAHNECKFNEHCAYKHTVTKDKSDIAHLLTKVGHLEDIVNYMSQKIKSLEEQLKTTNVENNPSSGQTFNCDQCEYKATKNSVLKRHKHPSIRHSYLK